MAPKWKYNEKGSKRFLFSVASQSQCCCCHIKLYNKPKDRKKNSRKGVYINNEKRYNIYRHNNIILGPKHRLCSKCNNTELDKLNWTKAEWTPVESHLFLNQILELQRQYDKKQNNIKQKDKGLLAYDKLTDEQFRISCGLHRGDIDTIINGLALESVIINVFHLFLTLCVWYNNLSYRFAAILFGYKKHSTIQYAVDKTITVLSFHWVPKWLGYPHWTIEKVIQNTPSFVRELFPDKKIAGVVDATFLYKEKSYNNYQYQRITYSSYKHCNLQKESVVCTCNGKILTVDGPYAADGLNNDAIIWDNCVNAECHELHDIFDTFAEPNDWTVVADRGYKDCVTTTKRFELLIPGAIGSADKKIKKKQLETKEANDSR